MAAPINDDNFSGGFGGASSHVYTPTYLARTAALLVAVIAFEQPAGIANSVTSVTDSNGLTWTRHSTNNFNGATTGNITGPVYTGSEIWTAQGNIIAGAGTLTVNFSIAVDHSTICWATFHGHNAAIPFDNHASLSSVFSNGATASTPTLTLSTATNNVALFGVITTPDNQSQTGILFNGGVSDGGNSASFSTGGTNWNFLRAEFKNFTTGASGIVVTGVTSRQNQLMTAYAITADVQTPPSTPGLGSHAVSIC